MNRLPDELQRMIFQYSPIVSPSAKVMELLIECRQCEPEDDGGCDFHLWWRDYFKVECRPIYNPKEYYAKIGYGDDCCKCKWPRTWAELQTEGYDEMCGECYEETYHPECRNQAITLYSDVESDYESEDDEY